MKLIIKPSVQHGMYNYNINLQFQRSNVDASAKINQAYIHDLLKEYKRRSPSRRTPYLINSKIQESRS